MPRYNPSDEEMGMDESYAGTNNVSPPEEASESVDEENAEATEVVVPNKVLMGPDGKEPKEGDEIVVKVVKNYGDESSIIYAPAKPEGETSETPSVDEEIAALDTKKEY